MPGTRKQREVARPPLFCYTVSRHGILRARSRHLFTVAGLSGLKEQPGLTASQGTRSSQESCPALFVASDTALAGLGPLRVLGVHVGPSSS